MHDTFLNQNLYDSIVSLCKDNLISKVDNLIITVHTDSHVSENSLRDFFMERSSELVGDFTNIIIKKREIKRMTAIIEKIEGEKLK